MRTTAFLFFGFFTFSTATFALGGYVGNGGDIVICTPSSANDFAGSYSLDFIATYQPSTDAALLAASRTPPNYTKFDAAKMNDLSLPGNAWWMDTYARLFRVSRQLAYQYRQFVETIYVGGMNNGIFWNDAAFGLVDLADEALIRRVPSNCTLPSTSGPKLYQAVVRQKLGKVLQFAYDKKLVQGLNSDLQFSYLMLHEFLWSHTGDVETIRFLNRLVHSNQIASMTIENFYQLIHSLGLSHPAHFASHCTNVVDMNTRRGCPVLSLNLFDPKSRAKLSSASNGSLTVDGYSAPNVGRKDSPPYKIQLFQGKNRTLSGEWALKAGDNSVVIDLNAGADPFDQETVVRFTDLADNSVHDIAVLWILDSFSW